MPQIQVVIDARDAAPADLATCVQVLKRKQVEVFGLTKEIESQLGSDVGARVRHFSDLDDAEWLLVLNPGVLLARGAKERMRVAAGETQLLRVLVPGLPSAQSAAMWSAEFIRASEIPPTDFIGAPLEFDREVLPNTSPLSRRWVRGETVGVWDASAVSKDAKGWSVRTGAKLMVQIFKARARSALGGLKWQLVLARQRRAHAKNQR